MYKTLAQQLLKPVFFRSVLASAVLALAGCGGGSGSGDSEPVVTSDVTNEVPGNIPGAPPVQPTEQPTEQPIAANPTDSPLPEDECSIAALNEWVDFNMKDYYLFYDQVPDLDLSLYDSPEELIRDLRFEPVDDFSFVTDRDASDAFFEEGRYFGFGYGIRRDNDDNARIAWVYDDSPFGRAGVKRGDMFVSFNGIPWNELSSEQFNEGTGTEEQPLSVDFVLQDGETQTNYTLSTPQDDVFINSVLHRQIVSPNSNSVQIGYLAFKTFIETSPAELDDAMDFFINGNVTELILDLRYNGGGRSSVSYKLASQIAGNGVAGQPLISRVFNDKYASENFSIPFPEDSRSLALSRVVVLTTDSTASASELVINGLKPYVEVITIGERSRGKSFGSRGRNKCDKKMSAIETERVNANGVSVRNGIEANCASTDDLATDFGLVDRDSGDRIEGMFLDALDYLTFGKCNTVQANAFSGRSAARKPLVGHEPTPGGDIIEN